MLTKKLNTQLLIGLILVGIGATTVVYSCKKKSEGAPVADFSMNASTLNEGNTLIISNKSTNGKRFQWTIAGLNWTSEDQNPSLLLDSAGNYSVDLKVTNGDGKTALKSVNLTVIADTVYRLTGNSMKKWLVKSIKYNGTEMLTTSCQLDDVFFVYKTSSTSTDTCLMTEGDSVCSPGTNLVDLPTKSNWQFNKGHFEFALTVGSIPFNLSFAPSKCTKWEFIGTDSKNAVSIRLLKK